MFSLVYLSTASFLFSNAQLLELLEASRANNESLGVSGMLLYKDGRFMQVLEGEEEVVKPLMSKIMNDARHRQVVILLMGPVVRREFPDWAMGFANLHSPDALATPGYSAFLETPLSRDQFAARPAAAKELLLLFKQSRL